MVTDFETLVNRIPNLSTSKLSRIMYGIVRLIEPEVVVETGAYCGHSTCWLAKGVKDNGFGTLYAIDNFSLGTSATILHNNLQMCGVADAVTIIDGDSKDVAWPGTIDMAFLDGNHSLEYVFNEFQVCADRGATCIVLHDTTDWWGPRNFEGHPDFTYIEYPMYGGMRIYMRKSCVGEFPVKDRASTDPIYSQEKYPEGIV